jgi:hypothetical protein
MSADVRPLGVNLAAGASTAFARFLTYADSDAAGVRRATALVSAAAALAAALRGPAAALATAALAALRGPATAALATAALRAPVVVFL